MPKEKHIHPSDHAHANGGHGNQRLFSHRKTAGLSFSEMTESEQKRSKFVLIYLQQFRIYSLSGCCILAAVNVMSFRRTLDDFMSMHCVLDELANHAVS